MKSILYSLLLLATCTLVGCRDDETRDFSYRASAVTAGPDFTDPRDSNVYHTIRVGNQLWLAENLRFAPNGYSLDGAFTWEETPVNPKIMVPDNQILGQIIEDLFKDPKFDGWKVEGTPIDNFVLPYFKQFKRGRFTAEQLRENIAYLNPAFDDTLTTRLASFAQQPAARAKYGRANFEKAEKANGGYVKKYGFLYSFEAAQKSVPEGWRLPSDKDWQQLEQAFGLSAQEAQRNNAWRGAGLGTVMSEGGVSGFNAPLGGANAYQKARGQLYLDRGKSWYYWTSTPVTLNDSLQGAIVRMSSHFNDKVWRGTSRLDNMARSVLYSVRCVKDVTATSK